MKKADFESFVNAQGASPWVAMKELWMYRDMLFFLVVRDFKIRYKQSLLSVIWIILQPLSMMVIFSMIVGKAMKMQSVFEGSYALNVFASLILWNFFWKIFQGGTQSIVTEAELVKKVYFPRLIPILSQVFVATIDLLLVSIFLIIMMLYKGVMPGLGIFLTPLIVIITALFATCLSLWFAPLNVRFRDIQIMMPLLQQLLFFASPVFYAMAILSEEVRFLLSFNPMAHLLEMNRYAMLGTPFDFSPMAFWLCLGLVVMSVLGLFFFNSSQKKFSDVI